MQSRIDQYLKINTTDDRGIWIRGTRTLRQVIGVLGMLLPLIILLVSPNCDSKPLESISHYYYTISGTWFSVILCLVGVFLMVYTKPFWLTTIAAICCFCVVLFPTSLLGDSCCIVDYPINPSREIFHYISAAIFLVILALLSIFTFPKQDHEEKEMKMVVSYKWLYVSCGVIMLVAIAIIGLYFLADKRNFWNGFVLWYENHQMTFWMEVVALECFGLSWLVRGRNTVTQATYSTFKSSRVGS